MSRVPLSTLSPRTYSEWLIWPVLLTRKVTWPARTVSVVKPIFHSDSVTETACALAAVDVAARAAATRRIRVIGAPLEMLTRRAVHRFGGLAGVVPSQE